MLLYEAFAHLRKYVMSVVYHIFVFGIGLAFDLLSKVDATSFLDVNIKIDVNEKTVVDESYPRGRLLNCV